MSMFLAQRVSEHEAKRHGRRPLRAQQIRTRRRVREIARV
jgi:hypothetical protein